MTRLTDRPAPRRHAPLDPGPTLWALLGWGLIAAGASLMIYAAVFTTVTTTGSELDRLLDRAQSVHNIGLLNTKLALMIAGGSTLIAGFASHGVDLLLRSIRVTVESASFADSRAAANAD